MPLPVIADVARVVFKGEWAAGTRHTVNVMHVKRASSSSPWEDVATALTNHLTDAESLELFGTNHSGWVLVEVDVTPLDGTTNTIVKLRGTNDWPVGHSGGDPIPQACALVKLTTAVRGKSGRGRMYLGPLSESVQASGIIDTSARDGVSAAWDAYANALIAAGTPMAIVVASYRHRTAAQATNIACESTSATQRRRQIR